jgi:hypothetical protein
MTITGPAQSYRNAVSICPRSPAADQRLEGGGGVARGGWRCGSFLKATLEYDNVISHSIDGIDLPPKLEVMPPKLEVKPPTCLAVGSGLSCYGRRPWC